MARSEAPQMSMISTGMIKLSSITLVPRSSRSSLAAKVLSALAISVHQPDACADKALGLVLVAVRVRDPGMAAERKLPTDQPQACGTERAVAREIQDLLGKIQTAVEAPTGTAVDKIVAY